MAIKRITLALLVTTAGCADVNPQPSLDAVRADVAERAALAVDWEAERRGIEGVSRYVASRLEGEMSVNDAVAISLLKNPSLQALYRELGVAQSDVVAAGLPQNPAFSIERRFRGSAAEFDVTQEFISLFLIPLRRKQAERQFESERLRVTHELIDHTADVRTAYFQAQSAEQVVELRRTVVQAMEGSVTAERALRAAGNKAVLDVALAERGANQAKLELTDAELEVVEAREQLNVLLGLWGDETRWRIPNRLPELPVAETPTAELERQAVIERFDLASMRAELESRAQSLGLIRITSVLPELSATWHAEREPEGGTTRGPSLSFPLSIFNRGQADRARATYMLRQAEDRYAALAIEIRSQVRAAVARMQTAKAKTEFYRRTVMPVQRLITEQTQLRYNGMFVGVFDLLRAKQEQIDSARDYIETLGDYWKARTGLEKVLARRLPVGELALSPLDEPPAKPHMQHQH